MKMKIERQVPKDGCNINYPNNPYVNMEECIREYINSNNGTAPIVYWFDDNHKSLVDKINIKAEDILGWVNDFDDSTFEVNLNDIGQIAFDKLINPVILVTSLIDSDFHIKSNDPINVCKVIKFQLAERNPR